MIMTNRLQSPNRFISTSGGPMAQAVEKNREYRRRGEEILAQHLALRSAPRLSNAAPTTRTTPNRTQQRQPALAAKRIGPTRDPSRGTTENRELELMRMRARIEAIRPARDHSPKGMELELARARQTVVNLDVAIAKNILSRMGLPIGRR
jgi:hypothetical protein